MSVFAKELDDVRCEGCADTLGAGIDCGGFTPTIVLTADVTICGVSNVTEEPGAEVFDCDNSDATALLVVELTNPGGFNIGDVPAVKLVDCAELDIAELAATEIDCKTETPLEPIVVTVLELDAGP
jgi:hypothetical protein